MGADGAIDYFFRDYVDVLACATLLERKDALTLLYTKDDVEEQVSIEMVQDRVKVSAWRTAGGRTTQGIVDLLESLPAIMMDMGSDELVQQFYSPLAELYRRSVN